MRRSRIAKRRHRGAVLVEYALLLTFFAVPICTACTVWSLTMLDGYTKTRRAILSPFP
jgi:Flp pilus assembly pilin Flp